MIQIHMSGPCKRVEESEQTVSQLEYFTWPNSKVNRIASLEIKLSAVSRELHQKGHAED